MKRTDIESISRFKRGIPPVDRLAVGDRVRDARENRVGVVLDFACQYAHPKAQPVYNYLIRWDDGQVIALSQACLEGRQGLEPLF